MRENEIHQDINIDPLTGLNNFIMFINEDFETLFANDGVIIIFNLFSLSDFNIEHGRNTVDKILITLTNIFKKVFPLNVIYRTEENSFTIILKDIKEQEINILIHHIKTLFKKDLDEFNCELEIDSLIYPYNIPIRFIDEYYLFVIKKSINDISVEQIFKEVCNRFKNSIDYFSHIYNFALIDDISGLPNAKAARQFIASSDVNSEKYAVLFIDGDDLRRYNNISYETGNSMIKKMSSVLEKSIRDEDKIFRWLSGDEFLIILDNVDRNVGLMLAERIRKSMLRSRDLFLFPTTVSIGVSYYPGDGEEFNDLIKKAEKANKIAKDNGKNKVVSWSVKAN